MEIFLFFGAFILAAVLWGAIKATKTNNQRAGHEERLRRVPDFQLTHSFIGADGKAGIGIDESAGSICLVGGNWFNPEVFKGSEILASEVIVDGASESSAVRSSQIGGALVGGVLLGGVGAVIGGLSGKRRTTEKISSISIRITIDDMKNPVHEIVFLVAEQIPHSRNDPLVKLVFDNVNRLQAQLEILIRRADAEDRKLERAAPAISASTAAPASIADELRKLADLKESGALDDEEYRMLKGRLLA